LKVNVAMENWWWNGTCTNGCPINKCQDDKDPKPSWPFWYFLFAFTLMPLLFHFCHTLHNSRFGNWPHLCRYACGYELEDNYGNNTQSIKWKCLAQFSIRWLYTRPEVVEMIFYH
jgi:hypothetical protein